MPLKNARAAVLAVSLSVIALWADPSGALGGEQPPLKGLLRDNFTLLDPPTPAPRAGFQDASGQAVRIADFAGRVVLLNFWATWCAPCVRELPTMDRLQARLGAEGLSVVAVSWDRGGLGVVAPFLERLGIEQLEIYLDPKGSTGRDFGVRGLPTTLLIDADGRIAGGIEGPLEWDSPEALELIRHYLNKADLSGRPVGTSG